MPKYLKTEGIILKRTNYRDADRIITILTPSHGKLSTIAKSVRKIKSKQKSHLELLNRTSLYLVKSKSFYIITQAQSLTSNSNVKTNLAIISTCYFVLEITDKLLPEEEPNPTVYQQLRKALEVINSTNHKVCAIAYHIKLLYLLGYLNDTNQQLNANALITKQIKYLRKAAYKAIIDNKKAFSNNNLMQIHTIFVDITQQILEKKLRTRLI